MFYIAKFYPCYRDDSELNWSFEEVETFYPCYRDDSEIDSTLPGYL